MTPALKRLIIERQQAFHSGERAAWLHYRGKVQKEILICKSSHYAKKVQHLKTYEPRKWWNCIKQITGKKRVSPNINVEDRDDVLVSGNDLADLLDKHFSSVSADLPPLDPSSP